MTFYIIDQTNNEVLSHHETAESCAKWFHHLRDTKGYFVRIERNNKRVPLYKLKEATG